MTETRSSRIDFVPVSCKRGLSENEKAETVKILAETVKILAAKVQTADIAKRLKRDHRTIRK